MEDKFSITQFVNVKTQQSVTKDLVDRFICRRKEMKISQKNLSVRSGVSYASIRRFEKQGEISLTSLIKISQAIHCLEDFDELFKKPLITNLKDYNND